LRPTDHRLRLTASREQGRKPIELCFLIIVDECRPTRLDRRKCSVTGYGDVAPGSMNVEQLVETKGLGQCLYPLASMIAIIIIHDNDRQRRSNELSLLAKRL
jgi:hypothetical protein